MARRRWATIEITVRHHIDDRTFSTVRTIELPVKAPGSLQIDASQLLVAATEAYATSERAANEAWSRMGAKSMHTQEQCNNPNCRIHPR